MLEVVFQLIFSSGWLFTLQEVAPIIGFTVMAIIVVVLIIAIVKWYQYCVKKGLEEYKREHGET